MIILKSDEEIEIMREAGRIRLFYQSVPLAFGPNFSNRALFATYVYRKP